MQGKFETAQKTPMDDEELMQGRFDPVQKKKANNTGLPSAIKSGIEQLSGTDISDVKVHYNSDKPARLQAHAYAQGTDIHIAPGEEKQLPHEAWHVVQQKQGRVQPTRQAPGNINVNDDAGLEREADVMGQKGLTAGRESFVKNSAHQLRQKKRAASADNRIVQRKILLDDVKADLGSLITEAHDAAERVILANWGWSATEHNFVKTKRLSAKQQLKAAIKSAKAQVIEVPALYSAANLKFLTKAAGRLPTLYFVSGNESGRIRQQHGGGPKVAGQTDKIDYFFADADGLDRFEAAARRAKKRNLAFNPTLSDYSATLTPTADALHYEVTYAGGRKIAKLHRSGGKVDPDISGYDDTRIKSIYQGAIGYTT
ncbi:MAG: DUF4157 domain-containing protein [Chromatiaceae bacterium]|nr:DUF4157 domain-containing protein [Chromatiaceae bacterium]